MTSTDLAQGATASGGGSGSGSASVDADADADTTAGSVYVASYAAAGSEPGRDAVDALPGATLLEFGAPWCGVCAGAQPLVAAALAQQPGVRHVKVEDGRGRRLGRSFGVKLWPTLVVLRDGQEVARLVRPRQREAISAALAQAAA